MLIAISNFIERSRRRLRSEGGFSMIPAITAVTVGSTLSLAAWQASHNDLGLQDKDRWSKKAYQAVQVGLADYNARLAADSNYWSYCDDSTKTTAVNDTDTSPRRWFPLPTGSGAQSDQSLTYQYTIDAIPTGSYASCKSSADRTTSMINPSNGTFRIRVTGRSGPPIPNTATIAVDPAQQGTMVTNNAANRELWRKNRWKKRSVVVDFRRRGFLDFAYFTDIEGQDPDIQANTTYANANCTDYFRDGRNTKTSCAEIQFGAADDIKGPFHTNDGAYTSSSARFGRSSADRIEVSDGSCPWRNQAHSCSATNPTILGTLLTGANAPVLQLPEVNEDLQTYGSLAEGGYPYTGITKIVLNDTATGGITVTNPSLNGGVATTMEYPTSGVIYVSNGVGCVDYDPDDPYPAGQPSVAGCGTVEVQGTYRQSLTIAAEADIVVTGNLQRSSVAGSGQAVIGLIANKFVRVRHYTRATSSGTFDRDSCRDALSPPPDVTNIQAAVLALQHSFMVDQWMCGTDMGDLTVRGVLAQKYRGAVGTSGGTGYDKDYNYDDTFRAVTPPYFLTPSLTGWRTSRYREQVPACVCL
jgi:hypothetical protein